MNKDFWIPEFLIGCGRAPEKGHHHFGREHFGGDFVSSNFGRANASRSTREKKLSEWLALQNDRAEEVEVAVRAIGTNALLY